MKSLLIEINKLIGESGSLRDEATLDYIVAYSENVAKDVAHRHPFTDGNKRVAFLCWYLQITPEDDLNFWYKHRIASVKSIMNSSQEEERGWIDILKDC